VFNKRSYVAVVKGQDWTLAKVAKSKLNLKILRLAKFSLQSEGDINDSAEHNHLKEWLMQQKVPKRGLKLAFSCPGVITRMINLPLMATKDLDTLLTEQVDQYFTINIADYLVDYRIVRNYEEDGQKKLMVLLAALPRAQWEQLSATLEAVGIKPKVVDLVSDSLARLYGKLSTFKCSKKVTQDQAQAQAQAQAVELQDIAVVDLGADRVELIILEEGLFFLYSDLEINLEALNDFSLPLGHGGEVNLERETSLEEEALSPEKIREELENHLAPVLRTLGEFFTFFAARHFGKTIDCIFLTGDFANYPFMVDLFETNLEVATELGFPHHWRPHFRSRDRKLQEDWMKYGSLYGLTFRED